MSAGNINDLMAQTYGSGNTNDAFRAWLLAFRPGAQTITPVTQQIAYTPSLTPDPTLGVDLFIQLAGNMTINVPLNPAPGRRLRFIFYQDAAGLRVVTWHPVFRHLFTPSLLANKINLVEFLYDGTNWAMVYQMTGL